MSRKSLESRSSIGGRSQNKPMGPIQRPLTGYDRNWGKNEISRATILRWLDLGESVYVILRGGDQIWSPRYDVGQTAGYHGA
jgi:hypothetical protein